MNILRAVNQSFEKCLHILHLYTLEIGVSQYRSRVVAHHAVAVSGARPLGEEATLLIYIHEALLHLLILLGVEQVQQREQTAERIPKTCACIEITLFNLTVVGAVMHYFAIGINLVVFLREERCTIQTRVECAILIQIATTNLYATQHIVPSLATLLLECLQRVIAQLLKIQDSLLLADK